jgi:hypothetical protein
MTGLTTPSVCIVGAGAMGIITAYHLNLAGAAVTFLVRPHHQERLSQPQILYSYDDSSLKTFTDYELLTDPAKLAGMSFDFVIITMDGAALRSEAGQWMAQEMGRAFRGTQTAIILGSIGIDLRSWFLEQSGLAETQVTKGALGQLIYEVKSATFPLHPDVNSDLLAKADYGYRHFTLTGFHVDLSAPQVAHDFTALYNRCGVSQCAVVPVDAFGLAVTTFTALAAWELLGWCATADIDPRNETWQLGAAATQEFQRLPMYGQTGLAASEKTNAATILEDFQQQEENTLPLDLTAFYRYHHGGKVNDQDHQLLREALDLGAAQGIDMPALRTLVGRLEKAPL